MAEPRELDLQALLALDLQGRRRLLIEAGAGTGKTYTLASLHLRLVLEGVPVRHIGAVTFTNAATDELRARLRQRLAQAWRGLREAAPAGALPPWWPLVEQALARDGPEAVSRRLREGLAALDEAPVHTLHGLCLGILRRHPGLSEAEPALDPDGDDRLLEAACAFWRERVQADRLAWEALGALGVGDPEGLREEVKRLRPGVAPPPEAAGDAARRAASLRAELADLEARLAQADGGLRAAWAREGEWLRGELLVPGCLNGRTYGARTLAAIGQGLEAWLEGHAPLPPEKLSRPKLNDGLKAATPEALRRDLAGLAFPDLVSEAHALHGRRPTLLRELGLALLEEALARLPALARRRRLEAGLVAPDDLLQLTLEALEGPQGPALARELAGELHHLFVDEFQDTDAVQYAILRHLEAQGTRLVLIGDPKQAIYGFRGADVHTYLRAREETPAEDRYRLTVNHRSRAAVCAAVNRLFGGHPRPFVWPGLDHPPARAAEGGRPALALPAELDPAPRAGLTLWTLGDPERPRPSLEEARAQAAAQAADHIAALLAAARAGRARLGERPLAAEDLAVLVRGHRQAAAMRQALARHGVPAAYAGQESVFASPAARDLADWLQALAEPQDGGLLRRALATSLSGLDLPGLRRALGEGWEGWLERADGLHRLWRRRGVLACLQRLLDVLGLEALAARQDGERLLTDLLHLGELLQRQSARLPEPAALAAWLRRQVADPPRGEETALRLESEAHAVRVLTVHKAKGLEFPVVYLPFLWGGPSAPRTGPGRSPERALYRYFADGAWRLGAGPEARAQAEREGLSEELRLLYVALTRAETKLYAWTGLVGREAGGGALDWLLYPEEAEAAFPFRCPAAALQDPEEARRQWRERLARLAREQRPGENRDGDQDGGPGPALALQRRRSQTVHAERAGNTPGSSPYPAPAWLPDQPGHHNLR
ncbi:MAG: hypothetical protein D6809_04405, partial [Gammaproteobacteria bacterium]